MAKTLKQNINYLDYRDSNLNYIDLAVLIKKELDSVGYIVIQNFNVDPENVEDAGQKFLELSELVGTPISHDGNNKIIWDIKSNFNSKSFVKTYSEHSHEAELHTDSQYSFYPEDYFGLLTLKKAQCGGGVSSLLSLKNILKSLAELENNKEILEILSSTDYPFIVPNAFKKHKENKVEFNYGPILSENEIRFRVDTFEKALEHKEAKCSTAQIEAYRVLKEVILNNRYIQEFYLEPKDLIFINNKTMLHGRSEFSDEKRHLIRIRMNIDSKQN
ncbi:hypothetical protein EHW67_00545 [Arenibacter aquaticus]|uniref:TauD/TfdA-like domain-containing protein n=1 Tax=Arenibacter aquaticus TaxID=2489054 RepID=A0A430K7U2_9FLAO|nr:TauD/TfdA family dioxygenase [Arenibacter aquaticus]RTE55091.1 hypothetical protein EHW67_00545 [Arenibacter aquaticus]